MIFKAPMDEDPSIRSFALLMKDSRKGFRAEKISDQALGPTPENRQEEAVGFMLSEGWLRENKPLERIEVDPEGEVRVRVNGSEGVD